MLLVGVACWGSSFVATRVALQAFSPVGLVAVRQLLGAALLLTLVRMRGRSPMPSPESRPRILALGLVLALHMSLQAVGMLATTAVNAGWIIAAIPAVIALGARLFLGQRLHAVGWWGAALATGGVFVVAGASPGDLAQMGLGDGLQALSCFTWAAYSLAGTPAVRRDGALRVTGAAMLVSAVPCLLACLFIDPFHGDLAGAQVAAVLFLGLLCSGVASAFWYRAIELVGPVRAGVALYVQPFFTMLASAVVLGEPWGRGTLLGGLVVLTGVALVQRGARLAARVPARP